MFLVPFALSKEPSTLQIGDRSGIALKGRESLAGSGCYGDRMVDIYYCLWFMLAEAELRLMFYVAD